MRVSNLLKSIATAFNASSNQIKYKSLTKENLLAEIEDAKWALTSVDSTMFTLSKKQLGDAYNKAVEALKYDKSLSSVVSKSTASFLMNIPKKLNGKAKGYDPLPIGAIQYVNKIMIKLLDDLQKNIDDVLTDKGYVKLGNTQLSHGLFLGVLYSAKMYSRFNSLLIAVISSVNSRSTDMPRYMFDYIEKHGDNYIDLLNQLCNVSGRYSVINDITNIRSHGLDFKFDAGKGNTGQSSKMVSNLIGLSNPFLGAFNIALNVIGLGGKSYVDLRHEHYTKIKEDKKWLETHMAILKMDLEGKDKNDPEYLKYRKMLLYYTDRIAEMDKKLAKYNDSK